MNFNSIIFFIFFAIVIALYSSLPWRYGRWMLVVASYAFYGTANLWYCFLLLTSTAIDFFVAQRIPYALDAGAKKRLLLLSISANMGMLGLFKYGDFFLINFNAFSQWFGIPALPLFEWVLPVGISFYTFQTLSYTIDVYRGKMEPTRDFASFALYVSFFPQLVAGPIERAHNLLPQLQNKIRASLKDIEIGFQRILWGLVKKVVFADRFGILADQVYSNPANLSSPAIMLGVLSFAFQLYLDFSAYTDIAIGSARLLGIRLSENFNWPFLSRNISEFWSRWHITLTNWFRDYVFSPIGGTKRSKPLRSFLNTVIVMTLVGIWHGSSWNFFVFGLYGGIMLASYHYLRIFSRLKPLFPLFKSNKLFIPIEIIFTFVFNYLILTIFFRASDFNTAWMIISGIFTNDWTWKNKLNIHLILVIAFCIIHIIRGLFMSERKEYHLPAPVRALFWTLLTLMIIYGSVDTTDKFIYFQF